MRRRRLNPKVYFASLAPYGWQVVDADSMQAVYSTRLFDGGRRAAAIAERMTRCAAGNRREPRYLMVIGHVG